METFIRLSLWPGSRDCYGTEQVVRVHGVEYDVSEIIMASTRLFSDTIPKACLMCHASLPTLSSGGVMPLIYAAMKRDGKRSLRLES